MSHPPAAQRARHPWRWVAGGVALLLVVVTVGGVLVYRHLQGNLTTVDVSGALGTARPTKSPAPAAEAAKSQPLNILVMGSDTRAGQGSGYGSASVIAGARSDTTMLVHLYADRQRALVVSIPRDTWTQIPACPLAGGKTAPPSEQRFNAAFGIGGPACSIKTLEALTGIYIDHFVVVDFDGFKKLVDALGGVKVCLNESVNDPKSKLVLSAGTHVVSGDTALAFVRARETLGDGSDIGRISRQQAFLSSMVQEVKSTSLLLDPVRLFRVLDAATASITTDPGLGSLNALRKLAQGVAGISPSRVTFVTLPWKPRGDGATVVVNESEAQPIFDAIRSDAPWPAPAAATASPSGPPLKTAPSAVHVRVLNATGTPGRATAVAAELAKLGFVVDGVGTASAVSATTTVRYSPAYDESGRTLTAAVKGAVTEVDPALGSVLELVVGTDYSGVQAVSVPSASPSASVSSRSAADTICY